MNFLRFAIASAFAAVLLTSPAAASEASSPFAAPATQPTIFSSERAIVEWAPGASRVDRVASRDGAGVASVHGLEAPEFQLVRVEEGQSMGEALAALRDDPVVEAATRDGYSTPNAIPNDPLLGQLWGLRNLGDGIDGFGGAVFGADINAPLAWDRTVGSPTTVIADIDTGYRFDSPDLGPVAWTNPGETAGDSIDNDADGIVDDVHGADFVGPDATAISLPVDGDPTDDNLISGGHGVHTAGTMGAAGNNGVGISGVAQNVRIMPLRVCADALIIEGGSETHEARCPFSSQVAAINYAGAKGARVANMSLGGTTNNTTVRDAIANNPQTLYVISAGNDTQNNDSTPHYPCNYNPLAEGKSLVDNVICVAATNQADGLASFSDWGATSVDLGAPGTETLSTYPAKTQHLQEDFETNSFGSTWTTTGGTGFGRTGAGDGPLTSFGMNDSPGGAPSAGSVHQVTLTTGVPIPPGTGSCALSGKRFRHADSGSSFFYSVLSDNVPIFTNTAATNTAGSAMAAFNTAPIIGLAGHSVKLRFGYTAGSAPGAGDGIWLDDLKFTCYAPLSTPLTYEFLQGTSMAAPHVTGAAGLLFSQKPAATVAEVRSALLAGVDLDPALSGKTFTGGRLDVAQAMTALDGIPVDHTPPAAPSLNSTSPASPASNALPKIVGSAETGSSVQIYASDSCEGAPATIGTAAELASPGIAVSVPNGATLQFSATASDAANNKSACSTPISYTNNTGTGTGSIVLPSPPPGGRQPTPLACTVPKLSGLSLGRAKSALSAAGCTLGSVTKPRAHKGRRLPALVVKSSTPAAGAKFSGPVSLKLGPKPKKHHR